MNDLHDDAHQDAARAAAAFATLRDDVEGSVDVEESLAQLHRSPVASPVAPPGRRRAAVAVAVASAAAVLVAAVLVVGTGDTTTSETVAADGAAPAVTEPAVTEPAEQAGQVRQVEPSTVEPPATSAAPDCREPSMHVYLEPSVSAEQVEAVRAQLVELAPDIEWEYLDGTATYEEFRRLFEGQTEFVESIRPEDLPTSFRGGPDGALASFDTTRLEQIVGVLRVEHAEEYLRALGCTPPS